MRQPLASDTPVHIEAGIIALLRGLPPARKLELARDTNRMADRLALAGLRRRRAAAAAHEPGYALALQRIPRHRAAELDLTGLLDRALEGQRLPEQGVTTG